ncbi:ATP-binding protein [Candidatus Protochlamydia phocaeensis]|uniref:ATP-binding protein n=1 Tax=Candidatus Protochlamydia phocaeensis TaxID=1414722 RepID=UPI000839530C|nr:ATP-binding protein [Candidatus Protochlamydia phocaeensis]
MHKKTFPASLDHLHSMLNFIQCYGEAKNIQKKLLDKIILAAEEALVNVILYGYPDNNGTIELTCEEPGRKPGIRISIKDQGIPFNPIKKASESKQKGLIPPVLGADKTNKIENRLGGYGIYLFVGIMDRVEYKRLDGGNILSLIKYF